MNDITTERLVDLRDKVLRGEEIPPEDYAQIIESIREGRRSGAETAASRKKAAKTVTPLSDAELDDLFAPTSGNE